MLPAPLAYRWSRMKLVGEVVRLQVQRSSLKLGARPHRWYDPTPLLPVSELELDPDGVHGLDAGGTWLRDVHHARASDSRNRDGHNGVSLGFISHYDRMRARFGDRLAPGIAGENILMRSSRPWDLAELQPALRIVTSAGATHWLSNVVVAEPCVEFTRYLLGLPADAVTDTAVSDGLRFLGAGLRGYYATFSGAGPQTEPARITVGALVYVE